MSGHSKWSTIKRKKAATDAKRGQAFTKVSRLITVAVKNGGPDPDSNPSLRLALDKAKAANMPKNVVERAITKGSGGSAGTLEEFILEGYGPHGVAVMVEALSDNRNRTVAEVRTAFSRQGGSLGDAGSAAYVFADKEKPLFEVELEEGQRESILKLLSALDDLDDVQEVYANIAGE